MNKMNKVISFSVFGDNPKYCIGMLKNIELAQKIYNDWLVYIYYNNSVPEEYINKYKYYNNVKMFDMSNSNIPGMFWRFLPYENIERFIVRDSDSRILEREKFAVDEWIKDDTILHIMRDHIHHGFPILGGMWGIKPQENLLEIINNYIKNKNKDLYTRMLDMDFLKDFIYPRYINNSTIHVSIDMHRRENHCKPFPTKWVDYRFVGEIINADDSREYQYNMLKNIKEL